MYIYIYISLSIYIYIYLYEELTSNKDIVQQIEARGRRARAHVRCLSLRPGPTSAPVPPVAAYDPHPVRT